MAHYEPPHQDLCCLQIQLFLSLVVKELSVCERMEGEGRSMRIRGGKACVWGGGGGRGEGAYYAICPRLGGPPTSTASATLLHARDDGTPTFTSSVIMLYVQDLVGHLHPLPLY